MLSIALIALLLAVFFYFKQSPVIAPEEGQAPGQPSQLLVDSADDLDAVVLENAVLEAEGYASEDGDADLIQSDSDALDGMGKTYDEKNL